jgi:hypothetical protein
MALTAMTCLRRIRENESRRRARCRRRSQDRDRTGQTFGPRDGFMSPLRKTAPNARPARRKGDPCRQVSWLAGLSPAPPSRTQSAQWHLWRRARRRQLRGQLRIWLAVGMAGRTGFFFLRSSAIGAPERVHGRGPHVSGQRPRFIFMQGVTFWSGPREINHHSCRHCVDDWGATTSILLAYRYRATVDHAVKRRQRPLESRSCGCACRPRGPVSVSHGRFHR